MDEPMMDEAIAETEHGVGGNETHAARWGRPELKAFNSKEKVITFQVNLGGSQPFSGRGRLTMMIADKSHSCNTARESPCCSGPRAKQPVSRCHCNLRKWKWLDACTPAVAHGYCTTEANHSKSQLCIVRT